MSDRTSTDELLAREKERRLRAYGLLASAAIVCAGLLATVVYLVVVVRRLRAEPADLTQESVRARAVAQLVDTSAGVWDSHPDPDVGRVLQPNLRGRAAHGSRVDSNAFGWREHAVAIPKPEGLVRVVLLGDSFIWGPGLAAEDRPGVFLERLLEEHTSGEKVDVEVLHVGMGSWNTRAETEYLRRNLSNLSAALVVQVAVSNDLDDSGGTRGFGVVADFSPQHPERTASLYDFFPVWGLGLGFKRPSHLNKGLSYEGRSRYEENAHRHAALARAVEAAGGRYLLVLAWADQPRTAAHHLTRHLSPAQVSYLPASFREDPRFRIGPADPHWSRGGSEEVARVLYGAILERTLLSRPSLSDWPEARARFRELQAEGEKEAALDSPIDLSRWSSEVSREVVLGALTEQTGAQIYGGVDKEGFVSPYASIVLARGPRGRVRISGRALAATELAGAEVRVFLDERPADTITLHPGAPISLDLALPPELEGRPFFDVRFTATDYVYRGPNLRQCVVFQLERLTAE